MTVYTKFRFDFTSEVGNLLAKFSDEHETEKYNVFQSSWNSWINMEGVSDILTKECSRLREEGYTGDVWDKMYKSARYYFKNKQTNKKPKKRRVYISLERNLLDAIDDDIQNIMNSTENNNNKPHNAYINFIKNTKYTNVINIEKARLETKKLETKEVDDKIKKTYKNRYYNALHK